MIFKNATVFMNDRFKKCNLEVTNGVFSRIEEASYAGKAIYNKEDLCGLNDDTVDDMDTTSNTAIEELPDGYIVLPGLVDIHTHGIMGYDFSNVDRKQLAYMAKCYIENGTTSLLPTLVTSSERSYAKSIADLVDKIDEDSPFLGINMEGPFISKEKKGSHNENYIREIDMDFIEELWQLSRHKIILMTAAPEKAGFDKLALFANNRFRLSMGHTACNIETAIASINMGANHITHLFNAMNSLQHRNPGLIGAAMNYPVMKELICDGVHLDKYIVKMMFRNYCDELCVISDSLSCCGLEDGNYLLGDMKVVVKDKKATLEDGTIAGSNITLFNSLKYLISIGINEIDAIRSVTYTPAKAIGMDDITGSIAVGRKADFLVCDKNYKLLHVYKNGVLFS